MQASNETIDIKQNMIPKEEYCKVSIGFLNDKKTERMIQTQ